MKEDIEAFFHLAPLSGVLTESQGVLLREICSDDIELDDFVDVAVTCGFGANEEEVRALIARMAGEFRSDGAAPAAAPAPTKVRAVEPEVDWFYHLAVSEKLLTEETCLGLLSSFDDATELMSLAQFLLSAGICEDVLKIQDLVDRATEHGRSGERPPHSLFGIATP